jgi:hypothetical protein
MASEIDSRVFHLLGREKVFRRLWGGNWAVVGRLLATGRTVTPVRLVLGRGFNGGTVTPLKNLAFLGRSLCLKFLTIALGLAHHF